MPPRTGRRKGQAKIEKLNAKLERLQIEYVPASTLTPNDYNPNRQNEHEFTLLKSSILEDGFTDPVKVVRDQRGTVIVDGEHRWRAVTELAGAGLLPDDTLAIVVLPMGEAQAKIATLRHNRARGSEDIELATEVLRDLEQLGALDWAQDSLDMSDAELTRLLEDIPAPEALAADEYGEAWAPGTGQERGQGQLTPTLYADRTPAGANAARRQEARLAAAKTDAERQQVIADRDVFRLSLVFSGDEAKTVRAQLGGQPAVTVLRWCQERAGVEVSPDADGAGVPEPVVPEPPAVPGPPG